MIEVIGVRFKSVGKIYYFDPSGNTVQRDDAVIVETARGVEYGTVSLPNFQTDETGLNLPLKKMIRFATAEDEKRVTDHAKREREAFRICQEKMIRQQLEMKLVDVEYSFDGSKILFYFTADGRVDFRELVRELASVFHTRIELRQIGVRDEAKMLGGLGICGRTLCCHAFLDDFEPVSIKMAKEQSLSLNPTKISGTCGRLMCCLQYEQEAYEDLHRTTPRVGATVKSPDGDGVVENVSLLRGKIKVRLEKDESQHVYDLDQLKVLHGVKKEPKKTEEAEKKQPKKQETAEKQQPKKTDQRPRRRNNRNKKRDDSAKNS